MKLSEITDNTWPMAGDTVDGRRVLDNIPNTGSIRASLDDYTILPGMREAPMSAFGATGKSYSVSESNRIKQLAMDIEESGEISPLIVVVDNEGPYILEGGHRIEALFLLRAKSFPAIVVMDESGESNETS
jgi:hypothetical protein